MSKQSIRDFVQENGVENRHFILLPSTSFRQAPVSFKVDSQDFIRPFVLSTLIGARVPDNPPFNDFFGFALSLIDSMRWNITLMIFSRVLARLRASSSPRDGARPFHVSYSKEYTLSGCLSSFVKTLTPSSAPIASEAHLSSLHYRGILSLFSCPGSRWAIPLNMGK